MCLGRIGTVTKTWDDRGVPMALVRTSPGADPESVCLMAVPEARTGMQVLVHLGFVVEIIPAEAATDALLLRGAVSPAEGSG